MPRKNGFAVRINKSACYEINAECISISGREFKQATFWKLKCIPDDSKIEKLFPEDLMASKKKPLSNKLTNLDNHAFQLMFEGHSAIMLLIEPQTGTILEANSAAVNFYGYPKSILCGMLLKEI